MCWRTRRTEGELADPVRGEPGVRVRARVPREERAEWQEAEEAYYAEDSMRDDVLLERK